MLIRELMGIALLALSWVTALMVALDALIDGQALRRRLKAWERTLCQGVLTAGELGTHEVEQRVKLLDGSSPGLIFFDRKHISHGGRGQVRLAEQTVEAIAEPTAEVWIDEATRRRAAACASPAQFDAMHVSAQAPGGGIRVVQTKLVPGDRVWLVGTQQGAHFSASIVSNFDPRGWVKARLLRVAGLIILDMAWVATGTALALWPPAFGSLSILGALVLVGHFLGMTPLAMAAREKSRTPAMGFIRGTWKSSAPVDAGGFADFRASSAKGAR